MKSVIDLFKPEADRRVLVVEEAADITSVGRSGKSFSSRILKTLARGRPAYVVEFEAAELRGMAPEQFLREIGRRIELDKLDSVPEKPTDERQWARWWSTDLPQWFGDLIEQRAKVIGADEATDIAVLKIEASKLPTMPWGDSAQLKVAEWVLAIGSPFGNADSLSVGVVSAVSRLSAS